MIRLLFFSCQLLFGCWDFWTFRMDQKNIGFFVKFFFSLLELEHIVAKKVTTVTEVKRFFYVVKVWEGIVFKKYCNMSQLV